MIFLLDSAVVDRERTGTWGGQGGDLRKTVQTVSEWMARRSCSCRPLAAPLASSPRLRGIASVSVPHQPAGPPPHPLPVSGIAPQSRHPAFHGAEQFLCLTPPRTPLQAISKTKSLWSARPILLRRLSLKYQPTVSLPQFINCESSERLKFLRTHLVELTESDI